MTSGLLGGIITFPNNEQQSPEYRLVADFYKAIFQADEAGLHKLITDDCTYVVHGSVNYEGKSGLTKMLDDMKQSGLDRVEVANIVADQNHAAINGNLVLQDGSQMSFAEFLTLSPEQKVQRVDSYTVAPAGE